MDRKEEFKEVERLLEKAILMLDRKDPQGCRKIVDEARLKLNEAIEKMEIRAAYE